MPQPNTSASASTPDSVDTEVELLSDWTPITQSIYEQTTSTSDSVTSTQIVAKKQSKKICNLPAKKKCSSCNKFFSNAFSLKRHMTKFHPENVVVKSVCSSKIKAFQCYLCGDHFKGLKVIRQHFSRKHCNKKCQCAKCGKQFYSPYNLNNHKAKCVKKK